MATQWSDTQLDLLHTQWRDPKPSLKDIATTINLETGSVFTRNAIAGKAHRVGLPLRCNRKKPRAKGVRPTRTVGFRRRPKCKSKPSALPRGEPDHLHLKLAQLTDDTCKFPRGDENFTFCGQSVQDDSPYCNFHHRLCYTSPERRAPNTFRRAA
jgi:GcrA cell cycle regulator